jgi:hypothetical protein
VVTEHENNVRQFSVFTVLLIILQKFCNWFPVFLFCLRARKNWSHNGLKSQRADEVTTGWSHNYSSHREEEENLLYFRISQYPELRLEVWEPFSAFVVLSFFPALRRPAGWRTHTALPAAAAHRNFLDLQHIPEDLRVGTLSDCGTVSRLLESRIGATECIPR